MTRYMIKTNAAGWPKVRNGTTGYSRPVIVDDEMFMSGVAAAKARGCQQSKISSAASNPRRSDVRFATLDELTSHLSPDDYVLARAIPRRGSDNDKTPPPAAAAPEPAPATEAFVGAMWPDGSVTVRLATGGDWQMSRRDVGELPVEIAEDCLWPAPIDD